MCGTGFPVAGLKTGEVEDGADGIPGQRCTGAPPTAGTPALDRLESRSPTRKAWAETKRGGLRDTRAGPAEGSADPGGRVGVHARRAAVTLDRKSIFNNS